MFLTILLPVLVFLEIFILPGFVIYFKKEFNLGRLIIKTFSASIVINIFSLSLLLILRNSIDLLLILFSSIVSILISLISRKSIKSSFRNKKKKIEIDKWLIFVLILSLTLHIFLFFTYRTIIGADVGRFSIISHAIFLKGRFETNLQPYDLATNFFYFPSVILFPPIFEIAGLDSITFLSFLTFLFSSLYSLPVYLITEKLFNKTIGISAAFFSSFLLNPILNIGFFGVFPYALSIFFFLSFLYFLLEEKNRDHFSLISSLFAMSSFHAYPIVLVPPFLIAMSIHNPKFFQALKEKKLWCNFLLNIIFFLPYLTLTFSAFDVFLTKENKLDLFMFSSFNRNLEIKDKISFILFSSPIGLNKNIILTLGFLSFIFTTIWFHRKNKKFKLSLQFLIASFLLILPLLFILFEDMNFSRSIWILWFFYAIGFSLIFNNMKLNLLLLLFFALLTLPPSIFSYFNLQTTYIKGQIPWIVWKEFDNVISFINTRIPINSTFIIDGGGSGCTGATASYGERIFPLTSRKIFYFTDYCWADYDKEEYRKRVEIYRRISINPNDLETIKELKKYNITHIFIGPTDVGLNKNLFYSSKFYNLIYDDGKFAIFKIL